MTVVRLFDLVMDKSDVGVSVSVSVAELFAVFGSMIPAADVTVAVLVIVPVAVLATVALTVNVTVPPTRTFAVVSMFTVPLVWPQLEPDDAAQVQVPMTRLPGMMSLTWAPTAALGPALLTTIV